MSIFTTIIATLLEQAYKVLGTTATTSSTDAKKTLGAKILLIKAISQDAGEATAVTFLQNNDTVLGPIAQEVVDALNGKTNQQSLELILALVIPTA